MSTVPFCIVHMALKREELFNAGGMSPKHCLLCGRDYCSHSGNDATQTVSQTQVANRASDLQCHILFEVNGGGVFFTEHI